MTQTPTARLKLIAPAELDPADVPVYLENILLQLDNLVPGGVGTLAARPVSTPASPGITGQLYVVTDQPIGAPAPRLDIDYGTGWFTVGPAAAAGGIANNSITTAMIQAHAITEALLALNSVGTGELIDGSVTASKLAATIIDATKISNTLKPSAGAGASTEALRALGTGSGQALPGNDPSVTNTRAPIDGSVIVRSLGGTIRGLLVTPATVPAGFKAFTSVPVIGTGAAQYSFYESGAAFPTLCYQTWLSGLQVFDGSGNELQPGGLSVVVVPDGVGAQFTVSNFYGQYVYPKISFVAVGW